MSRVRAHRVRIEIDRQSFPEKRTDCARRACAWVLLTVALFVLNGCTSSPPQDDINVLLDDFHLAASEADFERYFECLDERAVFIGTDATERWTRDEFRAFCAPYFERGQGWTYVPRDRTIVMAPDGRHATFDELLDNAKYGECRGVGAARRTAEGWKITLYGLSFAVPNDVALDVIDVIKRAAAADDGGNDVSRDE
ncbi:MAG: nuclear transport factor 2 family protein [Planctomycetota bacterium]